MRNLKVEQINNKNYLVGRLNAGDFVDEDCLAAVSGEQTSDGKGGLNGIIPIGYGQFMEERILRYDINSFIGFTEYKKKINQKEQLIKVFLSILDAYAMAEAYLLETSYFLLEQQFIYISQTTGKAWLILYPVQAAGGTGIPETREGGSDIFIGLFLDMLREIRLADSDMGFYGKVLYELNNMESFNTVSFRELLTNPVAVEANSARVAKYAAMDPAGGPENRISENSEESPLPIDDTGKEKPKDGGFLKGLLGHKKGRSGGLRLPDDEELPENFQSSGASSANPEMPQKSDKTGKNKKSVKAEKAQKRKIEIAEADETQMFAFSETDETVIADPENDLDMTRSLILQHAGTGKCIKVSRFPFEIGRSASGFKIDPSKTKVSRKHCDIIAIPGGFAVRDTSRHGTSVEGIRLPKEEYVPLEDGQHILLKDGEEFIVMISDQ